MKIVWVLAALAALPAAHVPAQRAVQPASSAQNAQAPGTDSLTQARPLVLDELVREAIEKSPKVQSAMHAAGAMGHHVSQAKALPDPMVAVGWEGNIAPFTVQKNDPASYRGVTVSQQFPYPGKLKLRGEMAAKDVETAQTDVEAAQRRIAVEMKSTYYEYFYYGKAIEITQRNKELLDKLSKISEARYRVGKAMQQDVLRSQVEISMLLEKLTMLEQQRATAQAKINSLLQREPESPLGPAADVQPATLRYSLDELYSMAAAHDVAAVRDAKTIEKARIGVDAAQREYKPDIGVAYMYQQRDAMQDMHGFTFSVNIPVFYKNKQRQGVMEASESLVSAQKEQQNRLNEVRFEIKQQYLAAKASEQLLSLYTKAVVPQSSLALESSMAGYQVGNVDFLSVLANFTTVWDYETDYYRQLADYETALANMEALTGSDVTGSAEAVPNADSAAANNAPAAASALIKEGK